MDLFRADTICGARQLAIWQDPNISLMRGLQRPRISLPTRAVHRYMRQGKVNQMTDKTTTTPRDFSELYDRPGYLIRRLHQIHVAMFLEECAEFKLTPVQFAVLTVLSKNGTLDQVSIAKNIGADRNTVADVLRRLERRKLLERPPNTNDKRTKLAKITAEGSSFVEAVQPKMIEAQKRLTAPISREEYDTLNKILQKLLQGTKESSRAPLSYDFE